MARKYEQLASSIIDNVGGSENISGLTHCVTRLRFQVNDDAKVNTEALKNTDGVVTVIKSAGQHQVVIGNHVPEVYAEVTQQANIGASTVAAPTKVMTPGARILDFISGIFNPIIGVLVGSGMLVGFLFVFTATGLIPQGSDLFDFFYNIGFSILYFIPVALGYTVAKKLNMNPLLGLAIGAALMHPALQDRDLNLFGLHVNVNYTQTVLPVILTVILASFIYKALMRVIPNVIKTFVVPMLTLAIAVPIGFLLIGPLANAAASGIARGIVWLYELNPILGGFVLGGLWQLLVITGLHMGLVVIGLVALAAGPTPLLSFIFTASFAQTAVVIAIWQRTRSRNLKNVALPAWISGIVGVTEPAIYGVTLPRIKYFIVSCIGAALGGAYLGFMNMLTYQYTGIGIFAIPRFFGGDRSVPTILIHVLIAIAIAMIPAYLFTLFTYRDQPDLADGVTDNNVLDDATDDEVAADFRVTNYGEAAMASAIASPVSGVVRPLSESSDQAFSQGMLGPGALIIPTEGVVVAPADGVVTTVFPTGHAIGLTTDDGAELLIHIGINTVELGGQHFTTLVQQGDRVVKGQPLVEFDMDAIKGAGYSLETPVIVTNYDNYQGVAETNAHLVAQGEQLLTLS